MSIADKNLATTKDFKGFLDPQMSAPIFEEVARRSVVQQMARKIQMGPTGVAIPFFDGDVTANWVEEAGKKPITKGGFDKFTIVPHKIASIFVISAEVARANPQNYVNVMKEKMAEAIAVAFDNAALHGVNTPFDSHLDEATKTTQITGSDGSVNLYNAVNNGIAALVSERKKFTGGLLDTVAEPLINGSLDKNGRPLFIDATYEGGASLTRSGRILGRPFMVADYVRKDGDKTVGYMGDWSKVLWGQVGGITYDVTDSATLDLSEAQDGSGLTSLWQHNLLAVRCEAEFAFHIHDKDAFVKIKETA